MRIHAFLMCEEICECVFCRCCLSCEHSHLAGTFSLSHSSTPGPFHCTHDQAVNTAAPALSSHLCWANKQEESEVGGLGLDDARKDHSLPLTASFSHFLCLLLLALSRAEVRAPKVFVTVTKIPSIPFFYLSMCSYYSCRQHTYRCMTNTLHLLLKAWRRRGRMIYWYLDISHTVDGP